VVLSITGNYYDNDKLILHQKGLSHFLFTSIKNTNNIPNIDLKLLVNELKRRCNLATYMFQIV